MADRSSTLEAAVLRTRRVLQRFGAARAPERETGGPLSALLLCRGGRLGLLATAIGSDVDVLCAMSSKVAVEFLESGRFDAFVIDAFSLGLDAAFAVEEARARPGLADVPLIVIAPSHAAEGYVAEGATRAIAAADLAAVFAHEGRRHRRMQALRLEMRATKAVMARETVSGLHGRAVFDGHLADIAASAEPGVTAAVLSLALDDAGRTAVPPAMTRAVGGLIATLTRAEDTVAEIAPGTFGLLFPGTAPDVAASVVLRLATVAENSAVLVPGDGVRHPRVAHAVLPLTSETLAHPAAAPQMWRALEGELAAARVRRAAQEGDNDA